MLTDFDRAIMILASLLAVIVMIVGTVIGLQRVQRLRRDQSECGSAGGIPLDLKSGFVCLDPKALMNYTHGR